MSKLLRNASLVSLLITSAAGALLGQSKDPVTLLREADHLADFYNWIDAGPIFDQAEQLFDASGQTRNALYAKIGRLRSSMESASLPELSEYLAGQLETRAVQDDRELK